jgi:hypothetical protein
VGEVLIKRVRRSRVPLAACDIAALVRVWP